MFGRAVDPERLLPVSRGTPPFCSQAQGRVTLQVTQRKKKSAAAALEIIVDIEEKTACSRLASEITGQGQRT